MKALETLYEKPPIFHHFHDRKVRVETPNTLVVGPKGAGKTALLLDYLSTLPPKSFLYLSLHDVRLDPRELGDALETFCKTTPLTLLVIDDYTPALALPQDIPLLLSSTDTALHVEGFTRMLVDALDFEEFMAFSKGAASSEHLFNLYANHGRSPAHVALGETELAKALQTSLLLDLYDPLLITLFRHMALSQSRPLSLHHLYQSLKPHVKLSKDSLYSAAALFERKGLLHFVSKFDAPKTPKKVYLNDFALKNALTFEKDFLRRFENIVFCELLKKHTTIYYTPVVDFYLPLAQEALVCIPFLPPELILRRFGGMVEHLRGLGIKRLSVLSVGNEGSGEKEGIVCEIIPFWEWALQC
ncbi:ATP-binding protein [Sulfurospirillum sp. T05]|uniref:ATP-binding protein n=1 Tax=Sulfurospirillum tamanense TaxID=2813362 RepID=A0ABS2WPE2_9BACT|nr:ATP-binding protein [Sulfurospirillum tamanensis]MBN2963278.1 ATP-binding protein [Sulfurospirillum tamanensis]